MIALHKIFQRNKITFNPIMIAVNIARIQPSSILRMFTPKKSVSESKPYR